MKSDSFGKFLTVGCAKESETTSMCVCVIFHTLHAYYTTPSWLLLVRPSPTWGWGRCDTMLLSAYRVISPSFPKIIYLSFWHTCDLETTSRSKQNKKTTMTMHTLEKVITMLSLKDLTLTVSEKKTASTLTIVAIFINCLWKFALSNDRCIVILN